MIVFTVLAVMVLGLFFMLNKHKIILAGVAIAAIIFVTTRMKNRDVIIGEQ